MLADLARIYAEVYAASIAHRPGCDHTMAAREACRDFISFLEESKTR